MTRCLFTGFFVAVMCCPTLAALPVSLKSGFNKLDLNQDGLMDNVIVAEFDNNTSHPNSGLTFIVSTPEKKHNIMPVANSDLFTWFDYRLSADADFRVQDNRLFIAKEKYYLVTAQKRGDDLFDTTPVEIKVYCFTESNTDPGVPRYDWTLFRTLTTKEKYLSADDAYEVMKKMALP